MVNSLYPDLNVHSQTQFVMAMLLLTQLAKNLILVFLALTIFSGRPMLRFAAQMDSFLFHFMQPLVLLILGLVDITHPGTIEFVAIHFTYAAMLFFATDSAKKKSD